MLGRGQRSSATDKMISITKSFYALLILIFVFSSAETYSYIKGKWFLRLDSTNLVSICSEQRPSNRTWLVKC